MRQRAGYAYFVTGDYYAAIHQYEKAFEFDRSDLITQEYLYYSTINAGSEKSRFYAGYVSEELNSKLNLHRVNPVESFDTEFNLKTNQTTTRSDQIYYRFGINSELGYRLSLYQAYTNYHQNISNVTTKQPEYLAILKYSLNPWWQLKTSYHHLATTSGGTNYPADIGYFALAFQRNRINLETSYSLLKSTASTTQQFGFGAGIVLPGRSNIYLNSSLSGMLESSVYRTIYSQTAGFKCTKNVWAEGSITLGNLKNYTAFNSLYVYNSIDPTIFRTGFSLFYFLGRHLSVTGNFTFDQREIENTSGINSNYYQYSYSGGLKWKL
jgi:tetratricopeptide (TPR) repeat protein